MFNNNPDDDVPFNGTPCSTLYDGTENAFEPVARRAIWSDLQACRYQKFLYFLRVGVRWGVTVEVAAPAKTTGGGGKSSGKSGGKSGASDKSISVAPTHRRRCSTSSATTRPLPRRTACARRDRMLPARAARD